MTKENRITINNLKDVTFARKHDKSPSAALAVRGKKVSRHATASAKVTLTSEGKRKVVKISGASGSIIRLLSALLRTSPDVVKSLAISMTGDKPVDA